MVWLIAENKEYWHFQTIFGGIVEVRKSRHLGVISAMAKAREKAFGS